MKELIKPVRNAEVMYGPELVDHLINYAAPQSDEIVDIMESIREGFRDLGHLITEFTPDGPDQIKAIRLLHDACQATISNIALNQECYLPDERFTPHE